MPAAGPEHVDGPPARATGRFRALLRYLVALVVTVVALAALVPRVSGAPWGDITAALAIPTLNQVLVLALLWAAGLVVHSRVLTAALPGLTVRRALTLNLTGSAISNVVPFGGGAGIGVNYVMARRWGFTPGQFSLFTGLVNAWHVAAKAVLPAAAVGLLLADGVLLQRRYLVEAAAGSALLLALVLLAAATFLTRRGGRITGGAADRLLRLRRTPPPGAPSMAERLDGVRTSALELARTAWRPMTWGVLAYNVLQAVLLWACLRAVGCSLELAAVVAVFAVERAATALPLTPGGSGVAEVAATAMVVALGGAPAAAAAGVLLYRAFVFGLEIPVGGTWLLGWWVSQRSRRSAVA